GHFERRGRGFYRLRGVPSQPNDDIVAAWLRFRSRHAVVSHETALALYDLAPSRSHEIHLTVPRADRPRARQPRTAVSLHSTTVRRRRDEMVRRFGVQVTSPSRTIADVADVGGDPSVVVEAAGRALATRLASSTELRNAGRRRSARVRHLITRALDEA